MLRTIKKWKGEKDGGNGNCIEETNAECRLKNKYMYKPEVELQNGTSWMVTCNMLHICATEVRWILHS